MWRWVRQWLWSDSEGPKAAPILVAEFYPPTALALYRALRVWQDAWLESLDPAADAALRAELGELAREFRRVLLRLQRLRHLVSSQSELAEVLHPLWEAEHLDPKDELARAAERLFACEPAAKGARVQPELRLAMQELRPLLESKLQALDTVPSEAR